MAYPTDSMVEFVKSQHANTSASDSRYLNWYTWTFSGNKWINGWFWTGTVVSFIYLFD